MQREQRIRAVHYPTLKVVRLGWLGVEGRPEDEPLSIDEDLGLVGVGCSYEEVFVVSSVEEAAQLAKPVLVQFRKWTRNYRV